MGKADFIIRHIQLSDIDGAMRLSNAEGLNQTEKDWKLLTENPQNVCMIAECGKKIIETTIMFKF